MKQLKDRTKSEAGFTLIELLTVIAIIGILAYLSINSFALYRGTAFDARAEGDLRNALTGEEGYYADNGEYQTCNNAGCNTPTLPGFLISAGTVIMLTPINGGQELIGTAFHPDGNVHFNYGGGVIVQMP